MRVAIAGKGGTGKTTLAGILARILARRGRPVLAVDADSNPNLGAIVGLAPEAVRDLPGLPSDLLQRVEGEDGESRVVLARPAEEVVAERAVPGPDGVRVLAMGRVGHAGKGCMCRSHSALRTFLGEVVRRPGEAGEAVVLDMEAGLEHMSRGTGRHVDLMVAAVEPYYRALETGRRVAEMARELEIDQVVAVANKVRDETDRRAVREYLESHGIGRVGEIPFDPSLMDAERKERAPLDHDAAAPAVRAISDVADELERRLTGGGSPAGSGVPGA